MIGWLRRMFERPERCDCPCHFNPGIMHVKACCMPCLKCGIGYRRGIRKHEATCPGRSA